VDEAAERFFKDFDIEILRSVKAASRRTTEAPPRPSGRRGRISERPRRPELTTLPLQSRPNASPFWIILLLSVGALDGGARPPALPGQTGVPAEMIVTDSSDMAAALAWTPVQGVSSYRIWRAGADNVFRTIGETQGPSYGDHGLAPATPYAWQVTAVVGGIEQPPSPTARASTRPTPPRCDTPGSCQ
jgi:hypothetical protein